MKSEASSSALVLALTLLASASTVIAEPFLSPRIDLPSSITADNHPPTLTAAPLLKKPSINKLSRSCCCCQSCQCTPLHRRPIRYRRSLPLQHCPRQYAASLERNVPFTPEAAVNGSVDGGWQALPEIQGMTLNRTFAVAPGAVMPFYQTQDLTLPRSRELL